MIARANISLWSILKNCIGKELSKITMPVLFNEPLSFLQRLTENVAYIDLIDKANESSDPLERMEVGSQNDRNGLIWFLRKFPPAKTNF